MGKSNKKLLTIEESKVLYKLLEKWFDDSEDTNQNFFNKNEVGKLMKNKLKKRGNWRRSPNNKLKVAREKKEAEEEFMKGW